VNGVFSMEKIRSGMGNIHESAAFGQGQLYIQQCESSQDQIE
jgi:hypothetical protein